MKPLLVAAAVIAIALPARASNVIGDLTSDTHWTVSGSPYNLTGDVTVEPQATLTIDPGVTVVAAASDGLGSGVDAARVELTIKGKLVANGSLTSPITFEGASAGHDTWYGIILEVGAQSSSLTFASISDTLTALWVKTGNSTKTTDLAIANTSNGVLWQSAAPADLERISVSTFAVTGLSVQDDVYDSAPAGTTALLANCTVQESLGNTTAVSIGARVTATLKRNLLVMNGTGVTNAAGSSVSLVNNVIAGNAVAGATLTQTATNPISVINNTFDQNFTKVAGIGLNITTVSNPSNFIVRNNIITNSQVGVMVTGMTPPLLDTNDVWGNTTNYSGVSAGPNSISANPLFNSPVGTVPANPAWTKVTLNSSCSTTTTATCGPYTQLNAGVMQLLGVGMTYYGTGVVKDRAGSTVATYSGNVSNQNTPPVLGNQLLYVVTAGGGFYSTGSVASYQYLPLSYDYRLQRTSPAIDAGTSTGAPTEDADGITRPVDGDFNMVTAYDLGAYEYHQEIPPTALAGQAQTVLPNTTVQFNGSASYDPDGTIVSYDWDFGDGSAHGSTATTSHVYTSTGTYSVKLTVTDNLGSTGTDTIIITVAANLDPVANAGPSQTIIVGSKVTLDGSRSYDPDGTVVSYQWDFGDGSPQANTAVTNHVYNAVGTYKATLTVTDNRGASSSAVALVGATSPVSWNLPPVARPGAPQTVQLGQAVTLDGSQSSDADGSIVSYSWDLGDGNIQTGPTVTYTYVAAGTYFVTLTVTDNLGATGSATTGVTVDAIPNQPPVAKPGGPYSTVFGQATSFDASASTDPDGTISSYAWDFGDGATGNAAQVQHTYAAPGSYLVQLTVTDNGGLTASASVLAVVSAPPSDLPPVAKAGGPYMGTVGQQLQFDASASSDPDGSLVAYAWDFGDGNKSSGMNVSHVYTAPGAYLVRLTVTDNNGAVASDAVLASVVAPMNKPPVANPGGPYQALAGAMVTVDGSRSMDPDGSIASYHWDFGDGATADGVTASHSYEVPGSYLVRLTVTDDQGATDSQVALASISTPTHQPPVANAGGNRTAVAGMPVSFDATGSTSPDGQIVGYRWDFGDGQTSTQATVEHTYVEAATYLVKLTVTDDQGATGHDIALITVSADPNSRKPPVAVAGADVSANAGDKVSFSGAGSMAPEGNLIAYQWDFGDGSSSAGVSVTHVFEQGGTYTVTLTVFNDLGLHATSSLTAHINELPVANPGTDREVAAGQPVDFDASTSSDKDGKIASYSWSFGDGGTATGATARYTYAKAGVYTATLTVVDDKGAQGTAAIKILVSPAAPAKSGCSSTGGAGALALLLALAITRRRRTEV